MTTRIMVQYACDVKACAARIEVEHDEHPEGWSRTAKGEDRCPRH